MNKQQTVLVILVVIFSVVFGYNIEEVMKVATQLIEWSQGF